MVLSYVAVVGLLAPLAIMAGGSDEAVARVAPLMDQLGGVFTHMGGVGAG